MHIALWQWAVIIVVAIVATYVSSKNAKKRKQELAGVAQQLGLTPEATSIPFPGFERSGLDLFKHGEKRTACNVMSGTRNGLELRIFDYSYETSTVTSTDDSVQTSTYNQTVAAFRSPGAALPEFHLKPAGILSKVARGLQKDMLLDGRERFNKEYKLKGSNPDAVTQYFTPAVVSVFEAHDHKHRWSVEACGDWLIAYREYSVVPPAQMQAFLDQTTEIAGKLLPAAVAVS